MPIEEVEKVLLKYQRDEEAIDTKLEHSRQEYVEKEREPQGSKILTPDQAKERNKELLKKLEMVKGNLRSKAIFSPMEMQWKQIYNNYKKEPSLVPIKYSSSHEQVFV